MKVAITYPPIGEGLFPLLPQNRQFRFTSSRQIRIYPLVAASAATILKHKGHEVLFLDGISRGMSGEEFDGELSSFEPDLLVIETKAPVFALHCEYVKKLKSRWRAKVALVGDHVSAFPEEALLLSGADCSLAGGDYDVALGELAEWLSGKGEPPKGLHYFEEGRLKSTGDFELIDDLDELPMIDRELTRWEDYGEAYLRRPCAYILSGRGCGVREGRAGVCTFCIWQHALWRRTARLRSPGSVAAEVEYLSSELGVKEVFDDNESGAIWSEEWLEGFVDELGRKHLVGKLAVSTNARADALTPRACSLLGRGGFRLLKVGLESAGEETLRRLCKQETAEEVTAGIKRAKDHGLRVLMTIMVGYPWETEEDIRRTYELARELMLYKTRFGDSLQASVLIPYPGTPLYAEALKNDWFDVDPLDYSKFDMSRPVLKTTLDTDLWCGRIWKLHTHPAFMLRSLLTLRSLDDLPLAWRGARSLRGHVKDHGPKEPLA